MDINPEYTTDHYRIVKRMLSKVPQGEMESLKDSLDERFSDGMWREQQRHSLEWMRQALARGNFKREEAASRLGIDRTSLGRWINGTVNPFFHQFQRFYVAFGGNHDKDHPFKEKIVLNFGGYINVVQFVRQWLQSRNLVKQHNYSMFPLDNVAFFCLYVFYSNIEPVESFKVDEDFAKYLLKLIRQVADYCGVDVQSIDGSSLVSISECWGSSWLLCLTLLAEEEMGVGQFKISANRPVRFPAKK